MAASFPIASGWQTTKLNSIKEVFSTLTFLEKEIWISRGHSKCIGKLVPKFDREPFSKIVDRNSKLKLEIETIRLFQETAFPVASVDEQKAMSSDMTTLMVLQHYGVPTRLLDWSLSPYVSAFFAVDDDESLDGELWCLHYDTYMSRTSEQWAQYPQIPANTPIESIYEMVFDQKIPNPDFFVCVFDYLSHHRIDAQQGLFSLTGSFGKDHAKSIRTLFANNTSNFHRYIIKSNLKKAIKQKLYDDYEIWLGSLFPDTPGIAEALKSIQLRDARLLI